MVVNPRPTLVDPFVLLLLTIDQPIAQQDPVNRRLRRQRAVSDLIPQLVSDSPCTPTPVVTTPLANQRLNIRGDPGRAGMRAPRLISQTVQPFGLIGLRQPVTVCRNTPKRSATATTGAPSRTSVTARSRTSTVTLAATPASDSTYSALITLTEIR